MINKKMIYKVLGALLYIEVVLQLLCFLVAWGYEGLWGRPEQVAFLAADVITFMAAVTLRFMGGDVNESLSRRDAFLVVTLSWLMFSLFGTLPFIISGYETNFTNAFFESISGFTTTGATIFDDVEMLPQGLLFWRSLMQWIGGLGIVFFTIAILPSVTGGSVRVFAAEATGPIKTKLHPRLSMTAKWIWTVYLLLTAACIVCYYMSGMNGVAAINNGMTTLATGGFGTHNMATEFFDSPLIEYTAVFFCFLAGINFILLWNVVSRMRPMKLFQSAEFRLYLMLVFLCTVIIMVSLIIHRDYEVEHAFRSALFSVVSFITTTGLFNDDAGQWPHITWIVLTLCMFIGAMSGSTSGGFKCIRGVMIWRMIQNEFRQILHPNAVLPMDIDGNNVSQQRRNTLMSMVAIYLLLFLIASMVLGVSGVDSTKAITITVSCLGNVGPTLGIEIGPTMSWRELPYFAKWVCSMYMLMGRLEIFTVLVIFTKAFWNEN